MIVHVPLSSTTEKILHLAKEVLLKPRTTIPLNEDDDVPPKEVRMPTWHLSVARR